MHFPGDDPQEQPRANVRAAILRSRLAEGVEAPARHGRAEHVEGAGVRAADGDRAVDSRPRRHVLDDDVIERGHGRPTRDAASRLGHGAHVVVVPGEVARSERRRRAEAVLRRAPTTHKRESREDPAVRSVPTSGHGRLRYDNPSGLDMAVRKGEFRRAPRIVRITRLQPHDGDGTSVHEAFGHGRSLVCKHLDKARLWSADLHGDAVNFNLRKHVDIQSNGVVEMKILSWSRELHLDEQRRETDWRLALLAAEYEAERRASHPIFAASAQIPDRYVHRVPDSPLRRR